MKGDRVYLMKFLLLILVFSFTTNAHALPTFDEVKTSYKKSDAVLLDRHREVIHELRVDEKGRRLDWVNLKNISPSLIKAVIHSEDRRFYEHHGVDWRAVVAAVFDRLLSKGDRGASTITMQLASILDKGLKPKGAKRTLGQKWGQIKAAWEIEKTWSKDELLEAYLNLTTFRGELQGVSSASRGIFNKEPSGLDEPESLVLASLIRSPNAQVGDVIKRACALGDSLKSQTQCENIKSVAQKLSGSYYIKPRIALASHVARDLLKNGTRVISTLDGKLQRFAAEVLKYQLSLLKNQNVHDGAVLVMDNKTGDILAYVANSGVSSSARYVDGIRARRQAGSTLKPFLYELAIEKRLITAASIIDDSPLDIPTPAGLYIPQDYNNEFRGLVSVRTALSSSLNVPAVRTLMLVGEEPFVARLRELGFENVDESGDYYGFSLALGSADISLYELVNAYRTLANGGVWSEPRLSFDKKSGVQRQVMKREATFIISNILSDREARSVTFGFENPLSTRFWTAAKTGTSKDMRDNWCIGYSQRYTVGVWVGNFTGEPMWNVTGITGAAPLWLDIMNYLHLNSTSIPPQPPGGVIAKRIEFDRHIETERIEWFMHGTEPGSIELNTNHGNAHITYPPNGTIIALDPDIPEDRQLLFFEAQPDNVGFDWMLNNKRMGASNPRVSWKPKRGKYILSLVDKGNRIIDSIGFEVR